jgi:hypothetical protein
MFKTFEGTTLRQKDDALKNTSHKKCDVINDDLFIS